MGIVIPCFNEAARLEVDEFTQFLAQHRQFVFCFVDDGSQDATWTVLEALRAAAPDGVRTLRLQRNRGKGEAVRLGISELLATDAPEAVGYLDADLATPLDQLELLGDALAQSPDVLMAFGSRVKLLGRRVERFMMRHYLGRVFATVASIVSGLAVYDTQCGAKLFRATIAGPLFAEPFVTRWLFDVEIFLRLRQRVGLDRAQRDLIEVPLQTWIDKGDSRLRVVDLVRVPLDFARIVLRYREGAPASVSSGSIR